MKRPKLALSSNALPYHIFAQYVYIWATLHYAALPRNLWYYLAALPFGIGLDALLRKLFQKGRPPGIWLHLSIFGIINTTFINIETSTLGALLFCAFLAVTSKVLFVGANGRHVFNPSAFAGVVGSVLLPSLVSVGSTSWGDHWPWLNLLTFSVGCLATFMAGTISLTASYILGFATISAFSQWALFSLGALPSWEASTVPMFFWPSTLLSVGSIIFIFGVISDPITAPKSRRHQVLYGLSIAAIDYFLRRHLIVMSEFLAYLFTQSLRVVLRDFGVVAFVLSSARRRFARAAPLNRV